ncbi:MAG TPA: ABC transporter ATP-binding protein [Acidimicrobiales bacterium]|nr:ABC transporter ATP-binding protein [Acidimicrobiales bacterium]
MLECRGLSKRFGDRVAVDGVSLSVGDSECYGLLGPNGAGKTTTISMVCGLLEPDSGTITVGGAPGGSLDAKAAVGYVPQDLALYHDLTARQNLEFFGQLYGLKGPRLAGRIGASLELVGLADRADDKVGTFSGGMKRRANMAAGLLHEPRLLVLDEPTVGVDPQSRNAILETVASLGIAVLYTTHYMEEASKICDRVGIIDGGRIIAEGTGRELVTRHGGADRVRLTMVADAGDAVAELADAIRRLATVSEVRQEGTTELDLTTDHGAAVLPALVELAAAHGLELSGVEVLAPDLETVFLTLTGKALRD